MIKSRQILRALRFCGLAVLLASFTFSARSEENAREKQIGGKFMCQCGCNQVLTQCNHVGCVVSASMLKELNQSVDRGDSEQTITQMFVQEFGTTVYAEPPHSGASLIAWTLPVVYLVGGIFLVAFIVVRWRGRANSHPAKPSAAGPGVSYEDIERARLRVAKETQD
jgi:cytochrome c-type biogenesis protein CcmH